MTLKELMDELTKIYNDKTKDYKVQSWDEYEYIEIRKITVQDENKDYKVINLN